MQEPEESVDVGRSVLTTSAEATTDSVDKPVSSVTDTSELESLPFGVLNLFVGGANSQVIWNAEFSKIGECMASQGWNFSPNPPVTSEGLDAFGGSVGQYLDSRSQFGYVAPIADNSAQLASQREFEAQLESLGSSGSRQYLTALYGPSMEPSDDAALVSSDDDAGCFGDARREDLATFPVLATAPFDYQEVLDRVQADPSVQKGEADWVLCMADAGYEFSSSIEPARQFSDRLPEDPPSQEEIAVAIADSRCFVGTIFSARRNAETVMIEELAEQFPEWAASAGAALAVDQPGG